MLEAVHLKAPSSWVALGCAFLCVWRSNFDSESEKAAEIVQF